MMTRDEYDRLGDLMTDVEVGGRDQLSDEEADELVLLAFAMYKSMPRQMRTDFQKGLT